MAASVSFEWLKALRMVQLSFDESFYSPRSLRENVHVNDGVCTRWHGTETYVYCMGI